MGLKLVQHVPGLNILAFSYLIRLVKCIKVLHNSVKSMAWIYCMLIVPYCRLNCIDLKAVALHQSNAFLFSQNLASTLKNLFILDLTVLNVNTKWRPKMNTWKKKKKRKEGKWVVVWRGHVSISGTFLEFLKRVSRVRYIWVEKYSLESKQSEIVHTIIYGHFD